MKERLAKVEEKYEKLHEDHEKLEKAHSTLEKAHSTLEKDHARVSEELAEMKGKEPAVMSDSTVLELAKPRRQLTDEDLAKQTVKVFFCFNQFINSLANQNPCNFNYGFRYAITFSFSFTEDSRQIWFGICG